jgi:hypothetical protein
VSDPFATEFIEPFTSVVPYFIPNLSPAYNAHRENNIFSFQVDNLVVLETTCYAKIGSAVQIKLTLDL